jgi:hypothetical protein
MAGFVALPPSRAGTAGVVAITIVFGAAAATFGRRRGWRQGHVLAMAVGPLTAAGLFAFAVTPIGDVPAPAKYAHNVMLVVGVAVLALLGARAVRHTDPWTDRTPVR